MLADGMRNGCARWARIHTVSAGSTTRAQVTNTRVYSPPVCHGRGTWAGWRRAARQASAAQASQQARPASTPSSSASAMPAGGTARASSAVPGSSSSAKARNHQIARSAWPL